MNLEFIEQFLWLVQLNAVVLTCTLFPFFVGMIFVKIVAKEDITYYLFDWLSAKALTFYALIVVLVFYQVILSKIVGIAVVNERRAVSLFFILPSIAASNLIFGRALMSDYQPSLITKFWHFMSWAFLMLMVLGLLVSIYI